MKNKNNGTVTLDIFDDHSAAALAQKKLKAEGIESFLQAGETEGTISSSEIQLKVLVTDVENAFEILLNS